MDMQELRRQIDGVDQELLRCFERRMQLARAVGAVKAQSGAAVFDPQREEALLRSRVERLEDPALGGYVRTFFQTLMALSKEEQLKITGRPLRLAYQGGEGSYSELAATRYFGPHKALPVRRFEEIFSLVESGMADFGVLPVENSTTGPVHEACDLLHRYACHIAGELTVRVEHCLLALPGAALDGIREVYSKDQALLQCAPYLERMGFLPVPYFNTAQAARHILEWGDRTKAAIAGRHAAEKFGLAVLDENIAGDTNATRFHILSAAAFTGEGDKATLCFRLRHESGSLLAALAHFARLELNLTRIESRPSPKSAFSYLFFVDVETDAAALGRLLEALEADCHEIRLLGHYKKQTEG